MLPDISVYPAHTCIRKHYESEAYNMELFDILQTAEEVSGIDMKAVLQAMGISVNVQEHTEQEQALICSFVSNFITLPAWRVDNDDIVKALLNVLVEKYKLPLSFVAAAAGVQKEQLASFQKGGEIPLSTKYTLAAQISRLSNMICPFDETMQALKQTGRK